MNSKTLGEAVLQPWVHSGQLDSVQSKVVIFYFPKDASY